MKKDIAMKWVNALRSGKYKQGAGQLFNSKNKTHCCLGVLCDILNVDLKDNAYTEMILTKAIKPSGIKVAHLSSNTDLSLYRFNDGHFGNDIYSFDEIADIIQLLYKEL